MIVAYPTVGFEKEMVSGDACQFHIILPELHFLGCYLRETWSLHHGVLPQNDRGLTLTRQKPVDESSREKIINKGFMRNTSVLATFTEVRSGRSAPLSFLV